MVYFVWSQEIGIKCMCDVESKYHLFLHVAWCYIRLVPEGNKTYSRSDTLLAQLVGYDIWVYATFIILPALYLTMLCYLRRRVSHDTDCFAKQSVATLSFA